MAFFKEVLSASGKTESHQGLSFEYVWEACRDSVRGGLPVSIGSKHFKATKVFGQQTAACDEIRAFLTELLGGSKNFTFVADNRGVMMREISF
jgi:hypothetical protein